MSSMLTWLDHDPAQRERVNRILALFDEPFTVDQLGLGGIRDGFADRLFPGTSTIQTRLRYFLFVPWMYRDFEVQQVPSRRAAVLAREFELRIVAVLRTRRQSGVIGGVAGESLKILPSTVYWGGLRSWGIRWFSGSRATYHQALDTIYERRKLLRSSGSSDPDHSFDTWHPGLPEAPPDWPEPGTLELRRDEAEFLRGRILKEHPDSLLAILARGGVKTEIEFPWQHPSYAAFTDLHKLELFHARLFSEIKHGAALVYNLALAHEKGVQEHIERYRAKVDEWQAKLDLPALQAWDLGELWELTLHQGHTITPQTRRFVERWVALVREERRLATDAELRELVRLREMRLKGIRSKFNPSLLETWEGGTGVGRLEYRWPVVQTHLNDLYRGLARD